MLKEKISSNIRDNAKYGNVFDFLKNTIQDNYNNFNDKSKLKIVSAYFTIYAFAALKDELQNKVSELKFILGEPSSIENLGLKNKRFKIFKIQDENITIENILKQNKIAKECYQWLKQSTVEIKTAPKKNNKKTLIHGKMYHIEQTNNERVVDAIVGSSNFTTNGLGISDCSNFELNTIIDSDNSKKDLKDWFNDLWENNTEDAKKEILSYLESIYKENSPEQVYYKTLYHIFEEKINEPTQEDIEKNTKFIETKIWKTLYRFQKDAVKSIVNKLNKHNGCIIADSVGLGKTYTALGVIQYFICKKKPNVLVLAPARLKNNWEKYTEHHLKNIFEDDGLKITLKFHTDLTANRNKDFKWGDFDLVVIDESHNFRNATTSKTDENGNIIKLSRYDKLMKDIIKEGARQPKILLLSATPVNTSLNDLKNQIRLIALDDDKAFSEKLEIPSLEGTIKVANKKYIEWADSENRDKENLLDSLNPNFFKLLDELTIARSRKQIEKGYNNVAKEIGKFPKRKNPKKICKPIDANNNFPSYEKLNEEILKYNLSLFKPSKYLKNKEELKQSKSTMSQEDRENYLIGMMKMGFLKRLESSIASFTISMSNTINKIDARISLIDKYETSNNKELIETFDDNLEELEEDTELNDFIIGKKKQYNLNELNVSDWKKELLDDRKQIEKIYNKAKEITPDRDEKLLELKKIITEKSKQQNKKVLIFTTYSDTAKYLFNNLEQYAKNELNLNIALVSGSDSISTYGNNNFDDILENFSPYSKLAEKRAEKEQIDILIGTDCISEGQNLQDCDTVINYDIHWNPVRLIQRFGRIDRIGSLNDEIQMVCFWPTEDLESYIKLRNRVEARMILADASATADDNPLDDCDSEKMIKNDLNYREKQLKKIIEEKSMDDFEDSEQDLNLSDFSLEDFRTDLMDFLKLKKDELQNMPVGISAIVPNQIDNNKKIPSGVIFCLKQKNNSEENKRMNKLQPYYLVYVKYNGEVLYTYENAKRILELYKQLCLGKTEPYVDLCQKFNEQIKSDKDIQKYNNLLKSAINGITNKYNDLLTKNIFQTRGGIIPNAEEQVKNDDDFELITWLVINGEELQ